MQNAKERLLKNQRDEQILAHQKEIEEYTRDKRLDESELAHTVALVKIQHEKKMNDIDAQIMQELDAMVVEQQNTLRTLQFPGFFETQDIMQVKTQMHLFSMVLKLGKVLENTRI